VKVFLTGATGIMGRSAVKALHEAGHTVVGLVRSADKAAEVAACGVQPHQGDLFDRPSLVAGMHGCDAVANLATHVPVGMRVMMPGAWNANDRIRTFGSHHVVEAAREAGVGRVIQQSLSYVYADRGDDWIDEGSPIDVTRYVEPVVEAEANIEGFISAGGDGVSLRFGLITGADPNSAWLLSRARAGKPTGMGPKEGWCHVIHPEDVGTAVVAALTAPSGIYNVGATPVRRGDLVDLYAQAGGRQSGRFYGPLFMRLGGSKIELLTRSQRVTSQRLGDRAGWQPRHPKLALDWFDDCE
jgi:nucleoside-diphosphate-sugar epimerase